MGRPLPGAVAIFVKTPGYSPVKTRLAQRIGKERAESLYLQSVAATGDICLAASGSAALIPYFAVAEDEAQNHLLWQAFPICLQGSGGLGERLGRVYNRLLASHPYVILIGADAPQMPPHVLVDCDARLRTGSFPFVLGPSSDGGFYLFGGREPLPLEVWTNVTYSTETTADEFVRELSRFSRIDPLPLRLTDLDRFEDIASILKEWGL